MQIRLGSTKARSQLSGIVRHVMAENPGGAVVKPGDGIRNALRWLSERRRAAPEVSRMKLIEEASLRFDLTPLDVDFLTAAWKEG